MHESINIRRRSRQYLPYATALILTVTLGSAQPDGGAGGRETRQTGVVASAKGSSLQANGGRRPSWQTSESTKGEGSRPSAAKHCVAVTFDQRAFGRVTVGCPKLWGSDEVYSDLDGIERDIDSISVTALQGLNPNSANSALVDIIQNSLTASALFDQAQLENNRLTVQAAQDVRNAQLQQLSANQQYQQSLLQQRSTLSTQIASLNQTDYNAVAQGQAAPSGDAAEEAALQTQLNSVNTALATLATSPLTAAATLTSTAPPASTPGVSPAPALTTPSSLPQSSAITQELSAPSFPAAIQMDNTIDLLHQRLAREFTATYDDLMRQGTVYLAEFDTSIEPQSAAKNYVLEMQVEFKQPCVSAYELYPSSAAYNVMTNLSKTTHTGLFGQLQSLFGFGLAAGYQHDRSTLTSGLSQSLYVTSFGEGSNTFGWDFGPPPYSDTLQPGPRATYAVLLIPRACRVNLPTATVSVSWRRRGSGELQALPGSATTMTLALPLPETLHVTYLSYNPMPVEPEPTSATGTAVGATTAPSSASLPAAAASSSPSASPAQPAAAPQSAAATSSPPTDANSVIEIQLAQPAPPNLIITANGTLIQRVRDTRGRALYLPQGGPAYQLAGNSAQINSLNSSEFGLLESDTFGPDTWLLADAKTIILNISRSTAGTDHFPSIRLAFGGTPSAAEYSDLEVLARRADAVQIGEWRITQPSAIQDSTFQPLFTLDYAPGNFVATLSNLSVSEDPSTCVADSWNCILRRLAVRIVPHQTDPATGNPIWLQDQAQVMLEARDRRVPPSEEKHEAQPGDATRRVSKVHPELLPNWPMSCSQERGDLVCDLPLPAMATYCATPSGSRSPKNPATGIHGSPFVKELKCLDDFKIWVDQPPYYGRPGIWGDQDPDFNSIADLLRNASTISGHVVAATQYEIFRTNDSSGPEIEASLMLLPPKVEYPDWKPLDPNLSIPELEGTKVANYKLDLLSADTAADPARLTITVPANQAASVPAALDLYDSKSGYIYKLPDLRSQLLPTYVTVRASTGFVSLQGPNLRVVTGVFLTGPGGAGKSLDSKSNGFAEGDDFVTFSTGNNGSSLAPGTYSIALQVGAEFIQAMTNTATGPAVASFTVNNPSPTVTSATKLSSIPAWCTTKGPAGGVTLLVTGTGFTKDTTFSLGGLLEAFSLNSNGTGLQACIAAPLSDIGNGKGGTFPVVATNPAPGGGTSKPVSYTQPASSARHRR